MYKAENKIGEVKTEYLCCKFAREIYKKLKKFDKGFNHLKLELNNKQLTVEFYKSDDSYKDLIAAAVFETYIDHVIDIIHEYQVQKFEGSLELLDWEEIWEEMRKNRGA